MTNFSVIEYKLYLLYTVLRNPAVFRQQIQPIMPSGLSYLNSLDQFISSLRGVWLVLIITMFFEMSVVNANSVDPDQTPHSAASDLGLHCLPLSHLQDARHKWV